ncbi:MAG: radical SAM protein [Bacteroidales bacterium]|nr:radical SAM protein [Bacteroidales bacterium]
MISKIYKILPQFFKDLSVEIHRDIRLLWFIFFKPKSTKKCKNDSFIEFQKSRIYGPLKHICYAPYTSMFFARNGKVSPCYASYNNESSSISESTISEIWFNGSFKKIRKEHTNCELKTSCEFCSKLILNNSFGSLLINKYEHYAFSKSRYPAIMEFELSNKCNLSCIMCDSNLSSSIASDSCNQSSGNEYYDDKFINELKDFIPHLQLAEFTGGDPFMIEEYYQIWEMIAKINPKCNILITTNANTMNPRIERLLETHHNIHFNVSIDSLEKENYENIRRNGNYEFALKNINIFIEYSRKHKTSLNILVCPMTINRHELGNLVDFANKKEICVYFHTVVKPEELSLKNLEKTQLKNTIIDLESKKLPQENVKQKTNYKNYHNMIKLFKNWAKEEEGLEKNENKEYSVAEGKFLIIERVEKEGPQFKVKFFTLLDKLQFEPNIKTIYNRLLRTDSLTFFEHLENKTLEELEEICKNFKPEED